MRCAADNKIELDGGESCEEKALNNQECKFFTGNGQECYCCKYNQFDDENDFAIEL